MSFDPEGLREAVSRHGRLARVVVAETMGSVPREVGAAMLVWDGGQSGTIGGGTLEFEAVARAREALDGGRSGAIVGGVRRATGGGPSGSPGGEAPGARGGEQAVAAGGASEFAAAAPGADRVDRVALGPGVGQCCGGAVVLLTEIWDADRLAEVSGPVVARPLPGSAGEMPLAVRRALAGVRNGAEDLRPGVVQGWMLEPVTRPARELWVWGAGHVGRAVVTVLAPLPEFAITWVDTAPGRFPEVVPEGVSPLVAADPAAVVRHAPVTAEHLILTYSHALDLQLCHLLLQHGFAGAGLIGSATKWARFRSRLRQLGHGAAEISRICCPIGQPSLGKHPQAIAVGVAATLLSARGQRQSAKGTA